jgi:hypothetical protein
LFCNFRGSNPTRTRMQNREKQRNGLMFTNKIYILCKSLLRLGAQLGQGIDSSAASCLRLFSPLHPLSSFFPIGAAFFWVIVSFYYFGVYLNNTQVMLSTRFQMMCRTYLYRYFFNFFGRFGLVLNISVLSQSCASKKKIFKFFFWDILYEI